MIFKNRFFLTGLILVIILLYPLLLAPNFRGHDISAIRILEIDKCFKDGQVPCRWVSDREGLYGYPLFNYYPPLPYYFGELIFLLSANLAFSVKVIFAISFVGAYVFMYLLASNFWGRLKVGFWAAFYTLLSFILQIFFPQDGIGISWGLMFFPLILLSLHIFSRLGKIQNFLLCAICLTFLILSTNLYLIFIGTFLIWIVYHYNQARKANFLFFSFGSLLLAFLLAAFYFLPSIWERNLVHNVSTTNPLYLLPKSAREAPQKGEKESYQILTGDSDIYNFQKGTNWFKFETDTKTHTIIRLSQFYFPDWKVFIDGKETKVEYTNNSLGLMTIILGEGKHNIAGRLFDTPVRTISNTITVGSSLIFIILFTLQFKKIRSWLEYYRKRVS